MKRTAAVLLCGSLCAAAVVPPLAWGKGSHRAKSTVRPQIAVRRTNLGTVLVDGAGRTLYVFLADKRGTSTCYGSCADLWPPLLKGARRLVIGRGVKRKLVGTTRRKEGRLQLTYNHHPLYTYAGDGAPGETNGEGLASFGGAWFVINPQGKLIRRHR